MALQTESASGPSDSGATCFVKQKPGSGVAVGRACRHARARTHNPRVCAGSNGPEVETSRCCGPFLARSVCIASVTGIGSHFGGCRAGGSKSGLAHRWSAGCLAGGCLASVRPCRNLFPRSGEWQWMEPQRRHAKKFDITPWPLWDMCKQVVAGKFFDWCIRLDYGAEALQATTPRYCTCPRQLVRANCDLSTRVRSLRRPWVSCRSNFLELNEHEERRAINRFPAAMFARLGSEWKQYRARECLLCLPRWQVMYKGQAGIQRDELGRRRCLAELCGPRTCSTRSRCSFAFRKTFLCIGPRQSLR